MDSALSFKCVNFQYSNSLKTIDDLSFEVPKGKIFALLGPNGCGKTTIIRLILGRLKPKSGLIRVFGVRPSSKGSDIPGLGVGYMPQELALFEEFTIKEILTYYGTIYHLEGQELSKRMNRLIEILNLPENSRQINQLSGGQQRRVSIAITMIHRPKLIILDEPTVGVDSLLRKKIWNYLEDICERFEQTVIITTHYIEEARSAGNVAFMKPGSILRQTNPQKILEEYKCKTLEDVFIRLCYEDMSEKKSNSITSHTTNQVLNETKSERLFEENSTNNSNLWIKNDFIDFKRVKAMIWKYSILTIRRPLFLIMFYCIPVLSLIAMKLSIGQSPYNIPIAVFNDDQNPILSQLFLDSIDSNYIHLKEYSDNRTAQQSVVEGCNYMSIVFNKKFTETFETRIENIFDMNANDLDNSEIKLSADMSNTALILYVFKYIFSAFEIFSFKVSKIYGHNIYRFMSPISVEQPIYGDLDLDVTTHFGPSLMIVLAHFLPMIISSLQIIYDRKNTSLERVLVSGVKPFEVFSAHMIQNFVLIISLVLFSMFLSFVVFENKQLGSYLEVYIMLVLQGILGMAIGLMGALILFDEVSVAVGISGLMLPLWILSGVLWPLESIPFYFRYISDLSPITQPLDALRSVMLRGWTYSQPTVLYGYLISLVYILVITCLNILLFQKFSDKSLKLNIWNLSLK